MIIIIIIKLFEIVCGWLHICELYSNRIIIQNFEKIKWTLNSLLLQILDIFELVKQVYKKFGVL